MKEFIEKIIAYIKLKQRMKNEVPPVGGGWEGHTPKCVGYAKDGSPIWS